MAASGAVEGPPIAQTQAVVRMWAAWFQLAGEGELGEGLIKIREAGIDPLEAVFTVGLRRFDKSGEYAADGALGIVPWLRSKCKLYGGVAAEHVGIGRQLEQLPQTQKAFANGQLGYQHVAVIARTAEHVGVEAVRKAESTLLNAAKEMDAGGFTGLAKNFEHEVDSAAALLEANRAHHRRYLRVGEPLDGAIRFERQLEAEGGAIFKTALNAYMLPGKADDRTPDQRRADALVELYRKRAGGNTDGAGPRPHLIVRATVETLAGAANSPGGEIDGGGVVAV